MELKIEIRIATLKELVAEYENNKKFSGHATEYKQGYNQALIDAHKREIEFLTELKKLLV